MGLGSHKNSYKELRHLFARSEILVNKCWPLGRHWISYFRHISVKNGYFTYEKCVFRIHTLPQGVYTWYEATISQQMILLAFFQLFLTYWKHKTILRLKSGKVTFQRINSDQKWPLCVHKKYIFQTFRGRMSYDSCMVPIR